MCAGYLQKDLQNSDVKGVQNYSVTNYTKNNSTLLYGQTISANVCDFNMQQFLSNLNAHVIDKHIVCDRSIVYAYTSELDNFVYVNGNKVNLQISQDESRVDIGYPLIMGSF